MALLGSISMLVQYWTDISSCRIAEWGISQNPLAIFEESQRGVYVKSSGLSIVRPPRSQGEKSVKSLTQDLIAGNKFIFTHAGLAFVFIAMAIAMFVLSSFSPLISIYLRDSLHAGSFMFGAISAMVGVGMIVGTQLVTRISGTGSKSSVVLNGLFSLGLGAGLLGAFRNTPMAALSTFTMGLAIAFVWIPAQDHVPAGNAAANGRAR
jgi:hypothetical protein